MSLTFGPAFLGVALTPETATVTVTKWDGAPVTLAQNVVIDAEGRVSFTVAESGRYKITARRAVYNDYFSKTVELSDGPPFDPSDLRGTVDYLVSKIGEGDGGEGGLVSWEAVENKPAVIAAGATQTEAKTVIGLQNVDNTSDANKPISSATQTALNGKANTTHTHVATEISNSTATGRSVLTATDAAAARTAIGAGTSSLAIGTTGTTAKAGNYQPTAANISDATTTGRSVLTATDAAAARTAIGAGTSNLALGSTGATAAAGNHVHAADVITVDAIPDVSGTNVQDVLEELAVVNGAAGLNTLGSLQGIFIPNGGTIPPEAVSPYVVVIEQA